MGATKHSFSVDGSLSTTYTVEMTNHRHRTHTQQPDAPQVHEPRDATPLIMLTAFILLVGVAGIVAALFGRRREKRKVLVSFGDGPP